MSAPEPEVRVDGHWYECDGCGNRVRPWNCDLPGGMALAVDAHAKDCLPLKLARLQARWDARDKALRALIEQWRITAGVLSVRYDATGEGELRGRSKAYHIAADELERAIGSEAEKEH